MLFLGKLFFFLRKMILFQDRVQENYYESLRRNMAVPANNPFMDVPSIGSTRHPTSGSNPTQATYPDGALSSSGVWTNSGSEQDKDDSQQATTK